MKLVLSFAFLGLSLVCGSATVGPQRGASKAVVPSSTVQAVSVEVYFSPKGGCTEAITREIGKAKETVLVQAYSFTSLPIANSLVSAQKRGVVVRVICDQGQLTTRAKDGSALGELERARIVCLFDAAHAIAHSKVIVIDGQTVVTGSFNFSKQAETSNVENLLVLRSKGLAARYVANWEQHSQHSRSVSSDP